MSRGTITLNMSMAGLSKSRLDESIEPWLPELVNRRVLKSISSELDDTVRPNLKGVES